MALTTCCFAPLAESLLPPDFVAIGQVELAALLKASGISQSPEQTCGCALSAIDEPGGTGAGNILLLIIERTNATTLSESRRLLTENLEFGRDHNQIRAGRKRHWTT